VHNSHCYDICQDSHITACMIYTALLELLLLYFLEHFLFNRVSISASVLLRLKAVCTFKYIMADVFSYIHMLLSMLYYYYYYCYY